MKVRGRELLLLAIGFSGCATGSGAADSPLHLPETPTSNDDTEDEAKSPLPMPEGRAVSFGKELERVAEVRGLSPLGEVRGLEVDRRELLAHVERAVALEIPEKALRGTESMLVGLGLVPPQFDYDATMLRLLSDKLAGLYDPHLQTMLIREGLDESNRKMTLFHELVHALQDQHYDVREVVSWSLDDTDRSGALSALAEGDATSAMFDGMFASGDTALSFPEGFIQEKMRQRDESIPGVPTIIHRSLKASYVDGISFVHALRRRGGWQAVDETWNAPPTTTEQVLHLDKYDKSEPALVVAVPPAPQGSYDLILHDTWGEQNLRLTFEEWMDLEGATAHASDWGGDRIVAYESPDRLVVIWHIVADTAAAAERMFRGFSSGYEQDASVDSQDELHCGRRAADRPLVAIGRSGAHVLLANSPLGSGETGGVQCVAALGYIETQLEQYSRN